MRYAGTDENDAMTTVLGIDIGGTGIKGAPVDSRSGQLLADRHRILTPHPATPDAVTGVVAELGGSTSHLASLARERGIPMVLGVLDATSRIPDGSQVAVDGVAGVVRWMS